eukprot:5292675-Amphidinium_carterae.2
MKSHRVLAFCIITWSLATALQAGGCANWMCRVILSQNLSTGMGNIDSAGLHMQGCRGSGAGKCAPSEFQSFPRVSLQ